MCILFVLKKLPSCKTHYSNNYDPRIRPNNHITEQRKWKKKKKKMKPSTTNEGRTSVGTYLD